MSDAPKIGLWSMILLCLNGIIGSGLFLLPGQVATIVGKWGILVYLVVAMIVMSIAWCFVKCAGHYSRSGGVYLYAKEAFGHFVGFEIGIMRWAVSMIAWASLMVGFMTALGFIYPVVMTAPLKQILIASGISLLGLLNIFGVKTVKRLSNVITLAKIVPLLVFVAVGLFSMQSNYLFAPEENPFHIGTFGSAALMIFYAFSGFEGFPVAAGEMNNPKKNVPLAIMTAVILSSLIYFLVQTICIGTLGPALAGNASPIADVAALLCGKSGKFLVSLAMLISIGGVAIASSFMTPRTCAVLAHEKMLPAKLIEENRFGAPHIAILISTLITCAIALSGSFVQLATISVISRFAQNISTCLALFAFDRKGIMQPFSHPLKKAIPLFALLGMAWLLLYAQPYQLLFGFGALLLGIPLYFLNKIFAKTPSSIT